ncbi:MAG: hypothetical protein Ct9H90mP18_07980 [Gammaproteobacteria bacterium]|nr:MAG: hypothetical protein Ct9H90mP18_07980 [Gammaproteobacteria bacterium]
MNLITISASKIIQQSDFLIEGHKIKKRIAVDTLLTKYPKQLSFSIQQT